GKKYLYDIIGIKKETAPHRGTTPIAGHAPSRQNPDIPGENGFNTDNISQDDTSVNNNIRKNDKNDTNAKFSIENAKINAYYDPTTKTIYLNENANKPHLVLLGHELYHSLPLSDQSKLAMFFRQNSNTSSAEFTEYKEKMMKLYGEKYADMGREFTEQDFWREFTAENCETL
ncbi:MAG: hypothetical protein RSA27_09135, partial [Oscillospiraceae bacterium]